MFQILSNRTYWHLILAQVIALLSTGLATVALGLLAYDLDDGFVLVVISVIHALGRALVRRGLKVLRTLNAGGLIEQDAQSFTGAVQANGERAGVSLRSSGWLLSSSWGRWAMEIRSVCFGPGLPVCAIGVACGGLAGA